MQRLVIGAAAVTLVAAGLWSTPATGAARPTCDGHPATIVGTHGDDFLHGTPGADVIVGRGGNDTIDGWGGRDWICGGPGSDRLSGNGGDDQLFGGRDRLHVTDEGTTERDGDTLAGNGGSDRIVPGRDTRKATDVIHDSISWESSPHGVHLDMRAGVATGEGHDTFVAPGVWVVGSDFADVIDGSPSRDLLSGGNGADRILGHGGNDRIVTDPSTTHGGADVAFGGPGDDQISAGGGEDVLRGGPGQDLIDDFGPAADRMYGGAGADMLFTQLTDVPGLPQVVDGGPGGNDVVDLHTQTINPSTLASSATWNMATGQLVFDLDHPVPATVSGFERADLSAWGTSWTIRGTPAADDVTAVGTWGSVFDGLQGDDTFWGSSYDDTFDGGPGHDHTLGMGDGTDTCISVEVIDGTDCENVVP